MRQKVLLFLLFLSLTSSLFAQLPSFPGCGMSGDVPPEDIGPRAGCENSFTAFIDQHTDDMVPQGITRKLRINTNVVFVQNLQRNRNFNLDNPEHMQFFDNIFSELNRRMEDLLQESCACQEAPDHYDNIHIEFVPNFMEMRTLDLWDHLNDPDPTLDTQTSGYIQQLKDRVKNLQGYEPAIDIFITNEGPALEDLLSSEVPLWNLASFQNIYNSQWYSAKASTDLTRSAAWHAPDLYLRYLNVIKHIGNDHLNNNFTPFAVGGFLHEYLHLFLPTLGHKDDCYQNVMNINGGLRRKSLTGCQVREMYLSLMGRHVRNFVECEDALEFDLTIDTDEVWSNNLRVYGDIVIEEGASLTVTCELHFSPSANIIVKRGGQLIVDGGILTGCGEWWHGINVEGYSDGPQAIAGYVELKNDAIIEYANTAISMANTQYPWPAFADYYGGLVKAENSTFRKCRRAVEFMRYGVGTVKDQSSFTNCTFEEMREGVTLWADNGVTFKGCTFRDLEQRGIHPYDTEVFVNDGCRFENMPRGVDIITTYPIPFAPQIGEAGTNVNEFRCEIGVNATASGSITPVRIINNDFFGGNIGASFSGVSHYLVRRNDFSSHTVGIRSIAGGFYENQIRENNLHAADFGSDAVFDNGGLQYWDNCFESNRQMDILVNQGEIFPSQGDDEFAAGNCFTQGPPEIFNMGPSIEYYVKEGTPIGSCKFPKNSINIDIRSSRLDNLNAQCGSPGFTTDPVDELCRGPFETIGDLVKEIEQLESSVELLKRDTTQSPTDRAAYERCLDGLVWNAGQQLLTADPSEEDKEATIAFFADRKVFNYRIQAYGLMVNFGELPRARTYLNELAIATQEESDFVTVQQLNLDYLANMQEYVLEESDAALLYQLARKPAPLSGYARSLYEVLTGEKVELDIPDFEEEFLPRQQNRQLEGKTIYSAPNPVVNGKHIVYFENNSSTVMHHLRVYDLHGKQWLDQSNIIGDTYLVDCARWPAGLYWLEIKDEREKIIYQTKIVVVP
ncbi:MAG: T9SS type A sorting domain-containing protein [Bacteroidota bacterium]